MTTRQQYEAWAAQPLEQQPSEWRRLAAELEAAAGLAMSAGAAEQLRDRAKECAAIADRLEASRD